MGAIAPSIASSHGRASCSGCRCCLPSWWVLYLRPAGRRRPRFPPLRCSRAPSCPNVAPFAGRCGRSDRSAESSDLERNTDWPAAEKLRRPTFVVEALRTNSLKTREIGRTAKSLSPSNRKLLHSFGQLDRHSPAIGTADFIAAVFRLYWLALVAQLDRASDYESEGQEFESLRARHFFSRFDWVCKVGNADLMGRHAADLCGYSS